MARTTKCQSLKTLKNKKKLLKNRQQKENKPKAPPDSCFGNWRSLIGEESWGTSRHSTGSAERLNRVVLIAARGALATVVETAMISHGTLKKKLNQHPMASYAGLRH